jgi:3' terminal RNA ribose 2'-O-methyltransferase Hen1
LARLVEDEPEPEERLDPAARDEAEEEVEQPLRLHERRLDRVAEVIAEAGAKRVLDLGCGDGKLLSRLLRLRGIEQIVGVEVSSAELARAERRFADLPETARRRLTLQQGSLLYRDARLRGFDAAALVEVIEHVEPDRLHHVERAVFGDARPGLVVVTTPNQEFNALFPALLAGCFRHPDHRFEWTREQFRAWAGRIGEAYGFTVRHEGLGDEHPELGAPSQMAVFSR